MTKTVTPTYILASLPWESDAQRKGFLSLVQYLRGFGPEETHLDWRLALVAAFFLQKNHESQVWWSEVFGERLGAVHAEIKTLGDETAKEISKLRDEFKAELASLEAALCNESKTRGP